MMRAKMIVADLDGTLLDDNEEISPKSIEVLQNCRKRGLTLVIATSRSSRSAMGFAELLGADAVISSGGACIQVGDSIIHEALISCEGVSSCIRKCSEEPMIQYLRIEGEHEDLTSNPSIPFGSLEYGHYMRAPIDTWISQRAYKITVCSDAQERVRQLFEHDESCDLLISYAGTNQHRLTPKFASKESALEHILKHYGFTWENAIAFGNDEADLKMIEKSGVGVAVGNATPDVKAVADIICGTNNEQGVAEFLQKFIEDALIAQR